MRKKNRAHAEYMSAVELSLLFLDASLAGHVRQMTRNFSDGFVDADNS